MEVRPGYKQTEVGVIPADWGTRCLARVSRKITDGDHATPDRTSDGYFLLSARNVLNGRIDLSDVDFVGAAEYHRMRQRCDPEAGDILISCSGTIGRVSVVPPGLELVLVRSAALVKVDRQLADEFFLQFWLQGSQAQAQIASSVNQGAQPNLFLNHIGRLACPYPPVPEQRAIAEALRDVDALLGGLERLIAKKRDLKRAVMQQLLTGEARLPGFRGAWEVKPLGALGTWRGGVTPSMQNPRYWEGGDFPWLSSSDVKVPRLTDTSQHLTSSAVREGAAVVVPAQSIVLVTRSGILRKFLPVALIDRPMAINQDIKALIPNEAAEGEFLLHALQGHGDQILASCLKAGTTVESVEFPWLKAFTIPIPPREEQVAIAAVLSDLDAELAALEARRDKSRALKQGMMLELLTGKTRLVQSGGAHA